MNFGLHNPLKNEKDVSLVMKKIDSILIKVYEALN